MLTSTSTTPAAVNASALLTNLAAAAALTSTTTATATISHDDPMLAKFNTTHANQFNNLIYSLPCTVLLCSLYSLVFVCGLFGNLLVFYVVVRNRAMQTVTNVFITNLAISDILMCLLCVPFTPAYLYMRRWPFGLAMCHTVAFTQTTSVYVSTLTLMSIAIDRYSVIMEPFQQRMRMSRCLLIVAGIWLLSLVLSSPFGWYMHLLQVNLTGTQEAYCEERWNEATRLLVASLTVVVQFAIPFVIIAYCYLSVSTRLNLRAKARPGSKTDKKDQVDRERKRRTNRMLVYMVVVFGSVWTPLNAMNLLNDWFIIDANDSEYYNICYFLSHLFAMSSTCYNPVLYAWKNDNFRKEFQLVLPCFRSADRSKTVPSTPHQRWQPEQTFQGNNETMQESFLTSSCVRSGLAGWQSSGSGGGGGGGGSTTCGGSDGMMRTISSDEPILLTDIEPMDGECRVGALRIGAETHMLPSGVLETNFEAAYLDVPAIKTSVGKGCRIRFEEDLPDVVGTKNFDSIA